MNDSDQKFYAPPNTLVNIDKMRHLANIGAADGKTTIIHLHAAYDSCENHEHEKYGFEEEGED